MEKVINNLYKWIDKIGKHNILLILFVFSMALISGLYTTFSIYTTTEPAEIIDGLTTYKFILSSTKENNRISIAGNTSKTVDVTVSNSATTKLKYGIYYSSVNDLTDVKINYLPNSKYKAVGLINQNSDYIVTIRIINKSDKEVTIDIGLAFGLEKGGDLVLDADKKWIPEMQYLNKAKIGSFVEYSGNNGCSNKSCTGINANKSTTNNGYCQNENYQYIDEGWRIAYIENEYVYLISAGAPECLCTNNDGSTSNNSCNLEEQTENSPLHLTNLNKIALKYCNPLYVEGGICNNQTTWAMNNNDFQKIVKKSLDDCYESESDKTCGYENDLIDIKGQYWLANITVNNIRPNYYIQNWLALEQTISDNTSNNSYGVRPIIKLAKKVYIIDGNGTSTEPYIISK